MGKSQTDISTEVVELATESFDTFCDDISGMFGVSMQCEQKEVVTEDVSALRKRFNRLVAVNIVDSKGALEGTFHVLFDQEGLFTIGGVIVMLPEARIMEIRQSPTSELAGSMVDAVGEAGNLLIGTWDRVFRDGLDNHGHFLQRLPAFIGKPWKNSQESIGLPRDEDFTVVLYEMTIASYPAFTCGVVFPKQMLGIESSSAPDETPAAEEEPQPEAAKETKQSKPSAKKADTEESATTKDTATEAQAKEPDADETSAEEPEAAEAPEQDKAGDEKAQAKAKKKAKASKPEAKKADSEKSGKAKKSVKKKAAPPQPDADAEAEAEETPAQDAAPEDIPDEAEIPETVEQAADADSEEARIPDESEGEETQSGQNEAPVEQDGEEPQQDEASAEQDSEQPQEEAPDEAAEEETAPADAEETERPASGKISDTIRKMTQSSATLPGESVPLAGAGELFALCAGDMMQKDVTWAAPEESVQQALAKMQQNDTGYILIGRDGVLEGLASRSDVTGAISPYLRSVFAKWRRPLDDATLNIKVKWIMSRPVRTVTPGTSLAAVMEHMCRFGGRAIPVVNEEGQVQGLITVFDILQMLLKTGTGISTVGKIPQEPPMA